jgi:lysophospholipase L1-like esterase
MLGTNDMIATFNRTAEEAAWGIMGLITVVLRSASGIDMKSPKILIIAPPCIGKMTAFMHQAYVGKEEESKKLGECFKVIADATGSAFIDSSKIITAADPDGIHIDANAHKLLGMEVAKKVKEII